MTPPVEPKPVEALRPARVRRRSSGEPAYDTGFAPIGLPPGGVVDVARRPPGTRPDSRQLRPPLGADAGPAQAPRHSGHEGTIAGCPARPPSGASPGCVANPPGPNRFHRASDDGARGPNGGPPRTLS